jgi:hypothetical protein
MTEAEQFAALDAYQGGTMIAFSGYPIAMRYIAHRLRQNMRGGLIAAVHDSREGTGLVVIWRDPVRPDELEARMGNCRWLLEEILAGRQPGPVAGKVVELWSGGFPSQTRH